MERLRTPSDNLPDMLTDWQLVTDCDSKDFQTSHSKIPGKHGGGDFKDFCLLLATMMISFVFVRLSFKLLVDAHCSTFCTSAFLDWILLAGMIRYVSSAYLRMELPEKVVCRSAAFTTYEAGPMADPWMILAFIDCMLELLPPNVVQCSWPWK